MVVTGNYGYSVVIIGENGRVKLDKVLNLSFAESCVLADVINGFLDGCPEVTLCNDKKPGTV